MRGLLATLVAAVIAFGLVACGSGESTTNAPTGDGTAAAEAEAGDGQGAASGKDGEGDKGGFGSEAGEGSSDGEAGEGSGSSKGGSSEGNSADGQGGGSQGGGSSKSGGGSQGGGSSGGGSSAPPSSETGIRGWGEEASTEEREAVTEQLVDYYQAREDQDWETVCDLLSENLRKGFEKLAENNPTYKGKGCVGLFSLASKEAGPPENETGFAGSVNSFRVQGDDGFAIYSTGAKDFAVKMKKEGDSWRIAYFEGRELSS